MKMEFKSSRVRIGLKRNAISFRHAVTMAMAVMSPAAAIFFNTIPQAGLVGVTIPLCYVVAFIIALLVANQFCQMATELPTSGSWYTFVAQGLNSRLGFIAGWLTLISYGLSPAAALIIMGVNIHNLVLRWLGLNIHWIVWFIFATAIVFAFCYFGIRLSLQVDLAFLVFEIGVCLLLAFIVLIQLGSSGQLTMTPLNPSNIPENANLFLGLVLAILSFLGFESAATLGEEIRNPRRTIPKAVLSSVILVGLFYVLMSYVATVGYGVENMAEFAQDAAPFDTIARRYGGGSLVYLIDLAGIISLYAVAVAITNGAARIVYAMSRERLFPDWLAQVHPEYRTPAHAALGLCGITLVIGIGMGVWLNPIPAFGLLGAITALAALVIYALVSVACFRYFWVKRRDRFHWLRSGILPLTSVFTISIVCFGTLYPLAPPPLNWSPFVVIAWIVLGVGVLLFLEHTKPEEIRRAGAIFVTGETEEAE